MSRQSLGREHKVKKKKKKKNLLLTLGLSDLIPLNVFYQWLLKQFVECEHAECEETKEAAMFPFSLWGRILEYLVVKQRTLQGHFVKELFIKGLEDNTPAQLGKG